MIPPTHDSAVPATTLYSGIRKLVTPRGPAPLRGQVLNSLQEIENAGIVSHAGHIVAVGEAENLRTQFPEADRVHIGCPLVTPAFVDCHTHPAWVVSRANEFALRLAGADYEAILQAGGGIRSSVTNVRNASDTDLLVATHRNLRRLKDNGVALVEGKSGYGLSLADEVRSLRAIRQAAAELGMGVEATCLAAHVVPAEYLERRDDYVRLVCDEVLPAVKAQNLASACDIFVEDGAFSEAEARAICRRARDLGMALHIHADQMRPGAGTNLALEFDALSADHCEYVGAETISALARANTTVVLLPGSTFILRQSEWAQARAMIDAGVIVALATDFNPGTSPICNPAFVMTLAVMQLGMTAIEALNAHTLNAAFALRRDHEFGSLEPRKRCAFLCWDVDSVDEIPYYAGARMQRLVLDPV